MPTAPSQRKGWQTGLTCTFRSSPSSCADVYWRARLAFPGQSRATFRKGVDHCRSCLGQITQAHTLGRSPPLLGVPLESAQCDGTLPSADRCCYKQEAEKAQAGQEEATKQSRRAGARTHESQQTKHGLAGGGARGPASSIQVPQHLRPARERHHALLLRLPLPRQVQQQQQALQRHLQVGKLGHCNVQLQRQGRQG